MYRPLSLKAQLQTKVSEQMSTISGILNSSLYNTEYFLLFCSALLVPVRSTGTLFQYDTQDCVYVILLAFCPYVLVFPVGFDPLLNLISVGQTKT